MADDNFEDDLFADLYDDAEAPKPAAAPAAPAPNATDSVKNQTSPAQPAASAQDANQDQEEEEDDDDDDINFNLGGTSASAGDANKQQGQDLSHEDGQSERGFGSVHKATAKDEGKMFIGGLNWETTDQSLHDYFSQFGEVVECTVMRDSATGRSRGFGFLTFADAKTVNIVMVKEHFLDGKIIDPKRAIPRDEQEKTSKIFVGGVSQECTDQEFRDYFAQFGRVVDATLMMDKDTGRPRGFGFVTFESEAGVDACINVPLEIHGKPVEVKRAQPRGNMREEEENNRGAGRGFKKGGDQNQGQYGGGMQQGANGMSPQVMAQYFQRMQQYFAMMQNQQMAMRGGMNPQQMMQMQQQMMQQQQMMGRGGPGGPGGQMNPQMMQQMQQQMMQQQQGQGQGPGSQGGDESQDGYDQGGYEQQYPQQPPQQQHQQQQHHGGGRGGRRGRGGYGGYNQQQMGGGGGAPTSWEGMYDDVPQPGGDGGPSKAPAGAPTGPKRMNQPGANYRGGGRGGNRGYHPYGR